MPRQRGQVLLLFAAVLVGLGSALVISYWLSAVQRRESLHDTTIQRLEALSNALIDYAAANGRLPCPADGTLSDDVLSAGVANPSGPSTFCVNPRGAVPWRTLSIGDEASLDGWGRRISYRVYAGAQGVTQTGGVSMVDCDTTLSIAPPTPVTAAGLCDPDRTTPANDFLTGKGLQVIDDGITADRWAFVLISHGASGNGAYLASGVRLALPDAGNVAERANVASATTFYRQPFSAPGVAPEALDHFDDVISSVSIADVARRAGLAPRDWPN